MLLIRKLLAIVICSSLIAVTMHSYAKEEVEDLIDVIESGGKILAIIEGRRTVPVNLRTDEEVLWSGSKGYLGAALTSQNLFAISTKSNAWQVFPLRIDESENAVTSLSSYIALLVTGDRAISFDAASSRFVEASLPIHDELLAAEADKYVAIVITSSRAFGFATKTSAFVEMFLRSQETIDSVKVTASKATVRTSGRLLTFNATESTWKEHRLY